MPSQWPPFIAPLVLSMKLRELGVSVHAPASGPSVHTPSPKRRAISTGVRLVTAAPLSSLV